MDATHTLVSTVRRLRTIRWAPMSGDEGVDVRFQLPAPNSEMLAAARALGDAQARTLGLLPYAAWDDYAERGRILCAFTATGKSDRSEAFELLGYSAFRTPRDTIALTHLAVAPAMRRRGVGRLLVDELRRRHPHLRGISARCRRDYPAHNVWPRLGFVAQGNRKGRSAGGHLLTDWWLDFGHPDLLTWRGGTETTTPVVVDTNVFLALHSPSIEDDVAVQALLAVSDRLQVLVTPELRNELNRNPDPAERHRLIQIAQSYPQLPVSSSAVQQFEALLLQKLSHSPTSLQDRSDARHVAYAMAAGIATVVTQDRTARSRLGAASRELGVVISNPYELVVRLTNSKIARPTRHKHLNQPGIAWSKLELTTRI